MDLSQIKMNLESSLPCIIYKLKKTNQLAFKALKSTIAWT